jgi:hypothetical protein
MGDPDNASAWLQWAHGYYRLGELEWETPADPVASAAWFASAVKVLRNAPQRVQEASGYRERLTDFEGKWKKASGIVEAAHQAVKLAGDMAHKGHHDAAGQLAEELLKAAEPSPFVHYQVARCYAAIVTAVAAGRLADKDLSRKHELQDQYTKLALKHVKQALESGWRHKNAAELEADADWAALRREPEFRKLLDQLRVKTESR